MTMGIYSQIQLTKIKKLWSWLRKEILRKDMIVYILIAELIFWSPAIFCGVMALFNPVWWGGVTAVIVFWASPIFTPAIPIQIGLALLLKKIFRSNK